MGAIHSLEAENAVQLVQERGLTYESGASSPIWRFDCSLLLPSDGWGRGTLSAMAVAVVVAASCAPSYAQQSGADNKGETGKATQTRISRTDIDDWVLECVDPPVQGVHCQATHTVLYGKDRSPVFVAAFATPTPGAALKAVLALPLNLRLKDGVAIAAGERRLNYGFDRCTEGGCFAEISVDAELFDAMTTSEAGTATVVRDSGEPFAIPFSFKGFKAALEAMALRNSADASPK